jgi:hypothetical protein
MWEAYEAGDHWRGRVYIPQWDEENEMSIADTLQKEIDDLCARFNSALLLSPKNTLFATVLMFQPEREKRRRRFLCH